MSREETTAFERELRQARRYLEYGSGGSTVAAAEAGVDEIFATESDLRWVEKLRQIPHLAEREVRGKLVFHAPDLGRIGFWGRPYTNRHRERWPDYSRGIWRCIRGSVDLVLVDGRFRVACLLATMLHGGPGTRLVVHDFWNRKRYHVVLPFLDRVREVGTLGVFVVRDRLPRETLEQLYREYAYDAA